MVFASQQLKKFKKKFKKLIKKGEQVIITWFFAVLFSLINFVFIIYFL